MTFAEFEREPDTPMKQELLRGELLETPPRGYRRCVVSQALHEMMEKAVAEAHARGEAAEIGEAMHVLGFRMGESYLRPDVSITWAGQPSDEYMLGAPAIAVEIIGESDTSEDIFGKAMFFAESGASEVWHVFLNQSCVVIWRDGKAVALRGSSSFTTRLIPGAEFRVADVLSAK
jgi:Uma2 family endonuclease